MAQRAAPWAQKATLRADEDAGSVWAQKVRESRRGVEWMGWGSHTLVGGSIAACRAHAVGRRRSQEPMAPSPVKGLQLLPVPPNTSVIQVLEILRVEQVNLSEIPNRDYRYERTFRRCRRKSNTCLGEWGQVGKSGTEFSQSQLFSENRKRVGPR